MSHGQLYGLVNESYPGVVKVGQTSRTTSIRASELSAATGVPTPFKVAFEYPCADVRRTERVVHRILEEHGWRVARNREFFRCSSDQVMRIIEDYVLRVLPDGAFSNDFSAAALLKFGDRLLARSKTTKAICNALVYYRHAVQRGSLIAYESSAKAYLLLDKCDREHERAIAQLKSGCDAGNYYCFALMALLFDDMNDADCMIRAWHRFFSTRTHHPVQTVEDGEPANQSGAARNKVRFTRACRQYIGSCLKSGIEPQYLDVLRKNVTAILTLQDCDLKVYDGDRGSKALLLRSIEWTYVNLASGTSRLSKGAASGHTKAASLRHSHLGAYA